MIIIGLLLSVVRPWADLDIELVAVLEGEDEGDRFGVAVAFAGGHLLLTLLIAALSKPNNACLVGSQTR